MRPRAGCIHRRLGVSFSRRGSRPGPRSPIDRQRGFAMLKIWGRSTSANVQKVLWMVDEIDLAYERIDAGGRFGGVDAPAYRALNPNARVPTIEDDGIV